MDLLHRFLDLGIAVAQSLTLGNAEMEVEAERHNLGVVNIDMEVIGDIIRPVVAWEEDDARILFEYILDCIVRFSTTPNAFMLADCIYSRYQRRVSGKAGMANPDPGSTIPH